MRGCFGVQEEGSGSGRRLGGVGVDWGIGGLGSWLGWIFGEGQDSWCAGSEVVDESR